MANNKKLIEKNVWSQFLVQSELNATNKFWFGELCSQSIYIIVVAQAKKFGICCCIEIVWTWVRNDVRRVGRSIVDFPTQICRGLRVSRRAVQVNQVPRLVLLLHRLNLFIPTKGRVHATSGFKITKDHWPIVISHSEWQYHNMINMHRLFCENIAYMT